MCVDDWGVCIMSVCVFIFVCVRVVCGYATAAGVSRRILLAWRIHVVVEHVLEVFPARGLRLRLAALAHVVLTLLEAHGGLFDALAVAGLVGCVALRGGREGSVSADQVGIVFYNK